MSRGNTTTIKRILREASELATHPSPDLHASPLSDTNLFEWHFTVRGPTPPSPFSTGIYHGRISLPPQYPLRPPSFRFLTPSGRFEVNREICLSISGHHEETWQPAWGIRTALVAIRAHMDAKVEGQVGGVECSEDGRRRLAAESRRWRCRDCAAAAGVPPGEGKTNEEVLEGERRRWMEMGGDRGVAGSSGSSGADAAEVKVPGELRLAYRDELKGSAGGGGVGEMADPPSSSATPVPASSPLSQRQTEINIEAPPQSLHQQSQASATIQTPESSAPIPSSHTTTIPPPPELETPQTPVPAPPQQQPRRRQQRQLQHQQQQQQPIPTPYLDRLIFALIFLLLGLIWRKLGKMDPSSAAAVVVMF